MPDLTCRTCGRAMRDWKQSAKDHPGTVARASETECNGCRSRARRNGEASPSKRGPHTAAADVPARERTPWGQFQLRPSHLQTSIPGADRFGLTPLDEETCHAAALTVAHYVPRDEIPAVLQMLGLAEVGAA